MGIGPFKTFQTFKRFAMFQTFKSQRLGERGTSTFREFSKGRNERHIDGRELRPPAAFSFGNTLVAEYVFERQLVRSFENVEIFHALHMFPSDKITHYEHVRPGDGPFQSFQ